MGESVDYLYLTAFLCFLTKREGGERKRCGEALVVCTHRKAGVGVSCFVVLWLNFVGGWDGMQLKQDILHKCGLHHSGYITRWFIQSRNTMKPSIFWTPIKPLPTALKQSKNSNTLHVMRIREEIEANNGVDLIPRLMLRIQDKPKVPRLRMHIARNIHNPLWPERQ